MPNNPTSNIQHSTSILVTGANGQLGREFQELSASYPDYTFTFADRQTLDLGNLCKMEDYFDHHSFDVIINCAAYTAVDKAESDAELANTINHRGLNLLAKIAKKKGTVLVHISTDYVFDGKNFRPYIETDQTNPQSVYGQTKLDGEKALLAIEGLNGIIIRTSWVYSSFGNNFVKTMLRLGEEREELGVIFDQVGTPTYAKDLAQAILEIIQHPTLTKGNALGCNIQHSHPHTEIYHYSNEGVASWYDFAKAIFEMSNITCSVNPIDTKAYPTPAKRPHYSLLNKTKIKEAFQITIPYWRESLKTCLIKLGATD